MCLGILYAVSAVASFFVPMILYLAKSEIGWFLGLQWCIIFSVNSNLCSVYLLLYVYLIPGVTVVMSFLAGVFFSVVDTIFGIM